MPYAKLSFKLLFKAGDAVSLADVTMLFRMAHTHREVHYLLLLLEINTCFIDHVTSLKRDSIMTTIIYMLS